MISIPSSAVTAAISARSISAPVASPPAWAIRSRWCPPSRVSASSPAGVTVELRPSGDQLGHLVGPLADQHPYGLLDAQTGAGHQGVVDVLLDGVALGLDRGDPALGPVRRPGRHHVLGHHHDLAQVPALQGGGQPGDAGADHHHVHLADPAGRLGGQPLRQPGQVAERGTPERRVWVARRWVSRRERDVGHHGHMLPYGAAADANARTWFDAWVESAYGADGFWRRHWPDEHFRTATSTSPLIAETLAAVLDRLRIAAVVDVGAGRGQLLSGAGRLRPGLRLAGIDLRPRPESLPAGVDWAEDLWDVRYGGGPPARPRPPARRDEPGHDRGR